MTLQEQTRWAAVDCGIAAKKAFIEGAEWERQRDKWISVKDHLPDEGQTVIIYHVHLGPNYNFFIYYPPGTMGNIKPFFRYKGSMGFLTIEEDNITHWMPLPEPPKERP